MNELLSLFWKIQNTTDCNNRGDLFENTVACKWAISEIFHNQTIVFLEEYQQYCNETYFGYVWNSH